MIVWGRLPGWRSRYDGRGSEPASEAPLCVFPCLLTRVRVNLAARQAPHLAAAGLARGRVSSDIRLSRSGPAGKKVVTGEQRRTAVTEAMVTAGISEHCASRYTGFARS
jgi:hypothetical protein